MWMDVVQEAEPEPETRSDDEDTVYDRNSEFSRRNPYVDDAPMEARGMLDEGETRCGMATWRPEFLQQFVTKKTFTGVFVITGILQGATWAYFTSSISTMEKRLKMNSETTGALLAGNELAQVIISIFFSYFAIRSHRMKFITLGASLWAWACFTLVFHQIFFGSGKFALSLTELENDFSDNGVDGTTTVSTLDSDVTVFPYSKVDRIVSSADLCLRGPESVSNSTSAECHIGDSGSSLPISMIFISQLIAGTGTMLFLSSGGPYVEDVIMPDKLPLVFGITLSLRLIGPFLGYVFASAFLRTYISSRSTPIVDIQDPRWMGAWWLGWLIIAILMAIAALIIGLFPRQMAKEALKKRSMTADTGPSMLSLHASALPMNSGELKIANPLPVAKNFMRTLLVFFNNNINLFITLSTIFQIFVGIGYWAFFPKYLEIMFYEPSPKAAMQTGSVTVVFNALGLLLSGYMISKYLPNAERMSLWIVLTTLTQIFIFILLTQFGCDNGDIVFGHDLSTTATPDLVATTPTMHPSATTKLMDTTTSLSSLVDSLNSSTTESTFATSVPTTIKSRTIVHLLNNCSIGCNCEPGPIIPLCEQKTGRVFYSPCHAGCPSIGNGSYFADCSCASENALLVTGFCQGQNCTAGFVTLLLLSAISQFLGSSGVIGKMLIFYRSVVPEGRSLVISLGILMVSIFAIIPGPIIFGAIMDSACHIWEHTCSGQAGHCWHYSNKLLRYGFNLAAAGFLLCGGCCDVLLWRKVKVKDVRLYDGDIDHIPKPSSSGNQYDGDASPRAQVISSAYS